jgi:hypothetical protein
MAEDHGVANQSRKRDGMNLRKQAAMAAVVMPLSVMNNGNRAAAPMVR